MEAERKLLTWKLPLKGDVSVEVETDFRVWAPSYYAQIFGALIVEQPLQGKRVLDVGCGSGVLAILAAKLGADVAACDLNPAAVEATRANAMLNKCTVRAFLSDGLTASVRERDRYDFVVCNSPSIPGRSDNNRTSREEWAENGPEGRNLLDSVLTLSPRILDRGGRLLTCTNSEQSWDATEMALQKYWSSFRILSDRVFPMDMNIFDKYLDDWMQKGAVWREDEDLYHNVKFLIAYK